ncbi:MAG TPA: hypothetical protein VN700_06500 [Vicinamibacterales bacterium]|nr:hypothetical protein [Vicinamibacterales bacterium]
METLSSIDRAEDARRDRAWRYERLTNELNSATRTIATLEAIKDDQTDVLREMRQLCGRLSPDLTTRGTQFLPGGYELRGTITAFLDGALVEIEVKNTARGRALEAARARQRNLQDAIRAVEKEAESL